MRAAALWPALLASGAFLTAAGNAAGQRLSDTGALGMHSAAAGAISPDISLGLATAKKSPGRALLLSAAGTLVPIAIGGVVLVTRPQGDPLSGEPADETYDVLGGALIGLGLAAGPSFGHFYAHKLGWLVPRTLIGGVVGLAAASSDLESGAPLALLGAAAVTAMAARDIARAPAAARRYNVRRPELSLRILPQWSGHGVTLALGFSSRL